MNRLARRDWIFRCVLPVVVLVIASGMVGCRGAVRADCGHRGGGSPDFGGFEAVPSVRIGSIPFPGLVSLYAEADPENLGEHVYHAGVPFEGLTETERGLVYTCRAGFLDLAHVRNTIDNAAHVHARLRYALRNGRRCVRFRVFEPSVYRVEIEYPEAWWGLGTAEREGLADEYAVRAAETLGLHTMTWHEILTWYGYKTAVIVDEKPSAFTYEDSASHAVGARVAGRALRAAVRAGAANDTQVFGTAVSAELETVLDELGVVDREGLGEAVESVNGSWWSGLSVNKRHLDSGVGGEPITPWLVPGLARCDGVSAEVFEFPALNELGGPAGPSMRVLIDPRVSEESRLLEDVRRERGLEARPDVIDIEADFPVLLELIGAECLEQFGPDALGP